MPVDLELAPKVKRPAGQPCCEPVAAGLVDSERRGLGAYYYVNPNALAELTTWLAR